MHYFVEGLMLGFAIAAPVGPIGVLCIRRTLHYGRLSGIYSGLGAASADMLYGLLAFLGINLLSDFLLSWQYWLRIGGGIFLIFWGMRIFLSKPHDQAKPVTHGTYVKDFLSTFLLTLSNPLTIFAFLAIFAGLGVVKNVTNRGGWLILGIFLGSCLWWFILCEAVAFIRKKVNPNFMTWLSRVAGLIIIGFGIAAFVSTSYLAEHPEVEKDLPLPLQPPPK
jgi:threonine/homoserine/homoserine lactone efflux protein